jgi:hypothetical protein|tara:strand:- start:502 stop:1008 length:507 start_codon:yes stop_codon:yes gene_type:complete
MAQVLFINRDDLVRFTSANGNINTDSFIQYIFIAQEIQIQRFLGTELYEQLEAKITANTLTGHYLTLVTDYIKPALTHWAMVEFLPFHAYSISNQGIFKNTSENAVNADKNEVDFLIEKERTTAQYFSNRLIDYLQDQAAAHFPEYYSNTYPDIYPDDQSSFGGWQLS